MNDLFIFPRKIKLACLIISLLFMSFSFPLKAVEKTQIKPQQKKAANENQMYMNSSDSFHWSVSDNGVYSIVLKNLSIKNCYPAIDGQTIVPIKTIVTKKNNSTEIEYQLKNKVKLLLSLCNDSNSLVLKSKFVGLTKAPDYFCPLAQGLIEGADRFFKQGLGFAGPSGVFEIPASPQRIDQNEKHESVWSYDSYLTAGIMDSTNNTIALGTYDNKNFLHRTTIYNKQNRFGLVDRWEAMNLNFYESGFSTEGISVNKKGFVLPDIHFVSGNKPFDVFRKLATNIARFNKVQLTQKPAYHFCTWYEMDTKFDGPIMNDFLDNIAKIKPVIPIQTVQRDDGYFKYYGDWLKFDYTKFPTGFENDIHKIIKLGYRSGIWVGPFMVHEYSDLFKNHPDWVLKNLDGSVYVEWDSEDGDVMVLDTSNPEAFEYIRHVFRTFREMGITYFKIDFMDWGLKNSLKFKRHSPGKTSVQYYYSVLEMIRQEIGQESFLLGCIAPFPPLVGVVDGARISNDVGATWSSGSHGNLLQEAFTTQYLNNILWQNDPDVCYFNSFKNSLSLDEIKTLAYLDGISGSIVNTSDRFHNMPPDMLKLWRFIQPSEKHVTAQIPFWDKPTETRMMVRPLSDSTWAVLIVNLSDNEQVENYKIKHILDVDKAFFYDWEPGNSNPLGEKNSIEVKLKKHESKLYYVSKVSVPPATNLGLSGITIDGL